MAGAFLDDLPKHGRVVIASYSRGQEAKQLALSEGLDFFLHDLIPRNQLLIINLDEIFGVNFVIGGLELEPDRYG